MKKKKKKTHKILLVHVAYRYRAIYEIAYPNHNRSTVCPPGKNIQFIYEDFFIFFITYILIFVLLWF